MQKIEYLKDIIKLYLIYYLLFFPALLINKIYPFNTILFRPSDKYGDTLKHICEFSQYATPYYGALEHDRIYNPIVYFYGIFCNSHPSYIFYLYFIVYYSISIIFIYLISIKYKALNIYIGHSKININYKINNLIIVTLLVILLVSSYPFLITLDRMNIDLYGFFLLILTILSQGNILYIFLGLFLSLKINYIFFLIFFVICGYDKKKIIGSILLAIGLNIFSLNFFVNDPIQSIIKFIENITLYSSYYMNHDYVVFTHSLWNIFVGIGKFCTHFDLTNCLKINTYFKTIFYITFLSIISYLFYIQLKTPRNRLLVLTSIILIFLTFQITSPDYRKIFLMLPILLIILDSNNEKLKILLTLLIICSLPKNISLNLFIKNIPSEVFLGYYIDPILLSLTLIYTIVLIHHDNFNNEKIF